MQECRHNNDILMYSIYNEGKSVTDKRFIKTLKSKIYEKLVANNSKSYLPYLDELVDQYNNTYHLSVNEKPINFYYSASTENIESNLKTLKFKVNGRVRIKSKE